MRYDDAVIGRNIVHRRGPFLHIAFSLLVAAAVGTLAYYIAIGLFPDPGERESSNFWVVVVFVPAAIAFNTTLRIVIRRAQRKQEERERLPHAQVR